MLGSAVFPVMRCPHACGTQGKTHPCIERQQSPAWLLGSETPRKTAKKMASKQLTPTQRESLQALMKQCTERRGRGNGELSAHATANPQPLGFPHTWVLLCQVWGCLLFFVDHRRSSRRISRPSAGSIFPLSYRHCPHQHFIFELHIQTPIIAFNPPWSSRPHPSLLEAQRASGSRTGPWHGAMLHTPCSSLTQVGFLSFCRYSVFPHSSFVGMRHVSIKKPVAYGLGRK